MPESERNSTTGVRTRVVQRFNHYNSRLYLCFSEYILAQRHAYTHMLMNIKMLVSWGGVRKIWKVDFKRQCVFRSQTLQNLSFLREIQLVYMISTRKNKQSTLIILMNACIEEKSSVYPQRPMILKNSN